MRKTLEDAYQAKTKATATVGEVQGKLDDLNKLQPVLTGNLSAAKDVEAKADDLLFRAASLIPRENIARMKDGSEILVVDGVVRIVKPVESDSLSVDDGQPDPALVVSEPATPVSEPAPPVVSEPATPPGPEVLPGPHPAVATDPAPTGIVLPADRDPITGLPLAV